MILDFGGFPPEADQPQAEPIFDYEAKQMHKTSRMRFAFFCSDNRKSKIQNRKWLGLSIIHFVLVVTGAVAQAQQPTKIPRIGFLSARSTPTPTAPDPSADAFRQGLRELGYIEGKNILVEYRYAEGSEDRLRVLVAELVQLKVAVVVSPALSGIRAAKEATKTIPIVMVTTSDPVAAGLIDSLARPGGNITGVTRLTRDLSGKRLELLKEAVPGISRVGILAAASATAESNTATALKDYKTAARALNVAILELPRANPDIHGAFQAAGKGHVNALITISSALLLENAKRIAELALKNRLPSMHERNEFVEAGGLISYSSNDLDNYKRAAVYVDKILKGAKPADLPVEQPTKFEFVINLKTAKQIGLTIPLNVLARADRLIR
jgi:putative ABC transport system substrate-binding protein